VEASFVWPSRSIRLTVDPDSHALPEVRYRTCRREIPWSPTGRQRELLAFVEARSATRERRYGAWLGLRDEGVDIEHKLYVEIPDGPTVAQLEARTGRFATGLEHRRVQPCMLGLASEGRTEVYCAVDKLTRQDLEELMYGVGLPARSHELVGMLEELWRCRIVDLLPSDDLGFSVAFDAGLRATTLTLYSTAGALLGGDRQIREAVLGLASRRGWPAECYSRLTDPLRGLTGSSGFHGMVGFVAGGSQEIQFTVTVAPPDPADPTAPTDRWGAER
jgi:hypothetical protein